MNKVAYCALNKIFGFKPSLGLSLIEHTGSAEKIFTLSRDELRALIGPDSHILNQICSQALVEANEELEKTRREGAVFLCHNESSYPKLLKECQDPPLGLYVKSSDSIENIFGKYPSIAIVGTREMSVYGKDWCRNFLEALSSSGQKALIVSGLAYGVDITAHLAALEYGLPTVAVMATGIERIYPSKHIHIADRIVESPGSAIISDYPIGTAPLPLHFLRRNRIIAGLSSSIILVESRKKGGGMMTARLGTSYNRDVYALPGRLKDIRSQGCNILIKEKIAEPVSENEDMLLRLGFRTYHKGRKQSRLDTILNISPEEKEKLISIAKIIEKEPGIDISGLSEISGFTFGAVTAATEMLMAEGIIDMDILGHCHYN